VSFDPIDDPFLLEEKYLNGPITQFDFLKEIKPAIKPKPKGRVRIESTDMSGILKREKAEGRRKATKEYLLELFKSDLLTVEIVKILKMSWHSFSRIIKKHGIEEEYRERKRKIKSAMQTERKRLEREGLNAV